MPKSLKGTQTEKNLLTAFAGESQARNRYTYFASAARKAGYEQIAEIFLETAENEKEHAKVFFKYLEGGEAVVSASYPAGVIADTKANLTEAADGENMEWTTIYADFARTAKKEGFPKIAKSFEEISKVEKFHEARYRKLIANLVEEKGLQKRRGFEMALPQLRLRPRGDVGPQGLPGLPPSPGLLRDPGGELLIGKTI